MNGQTSDALLSLFDSARLRPRYWINFSLLSLITVLEFFDFRHRRLPARGVETHGVPMALHEEAEAKAAERPAIAL